MKHNMKKRFFFSLLLLIPLMGCQKSTKNETYFNVTIETSEHGVVTSDKEKVKQGDFVTFKFQPAEGYHTSSFVVNDENQQIEFDHFTVFDVQKDLSVKATFDLSKIKVRYFNKNELMLIRNVLPGEDASYFGNTPKKDNEAGKVFQFKGWSLQQDGEVINSFVFNQSTDLYSVFEEAVFDFEMEASLNIRTLHQANLNIVTDYPADIVKNGIICEDPEICEIDSVYNVIGRKSGHTKINFAVGGTVLKSCDVTVTNIDNVRTELCYASGAVEYNDNFSVGRYKACQTLMRDLNGNLINQKYIDFQGDFIFDADLSSSDNFGIQFNKETYTSSGAVKSAFQFGGTTGNSGNIYLKVNGSATNTASYELVAGELYNFRVKTSEGSTSSQIHIECYINGTKLIDVEKNNLTSATNYIGLRYANASTSSHYITFSNLYLQ